MEHIATDQELRVTAADSEGVIRRKATDALILNVKEGGIAHVPALRVLRIVLDVTETTARKLASVLRGTVYENRGASRRGYRLLEQVLLTPEQARTPITRYFLGLPPGQKKVHVQAVLPSEPDAISVLATKTGISRELADKALQLMHQQGLVSLQRDSDGWVDLIRWK